MEPQAQIRFPSIRNVPIISRRIELFKSAPVLRDDGKAAGEKFRIIHFQRAARTDPNQQGSV
jgi:hypothetical protein